MTSWKISKIEASSTGSNGKTYLGEVQIYPRHAKEIIQKVESYRHDLLEPFKSEPITVVGEVVRHRNSYQNNKTYPEFGIFLV
ncbi:unnamed protein product [Caenorhabditis nigoni]